MLDRCGRQLLSRALVKPAAAQQPRDLVAAPGWNNRREDNVADVLAASAGGGVTRTSPPICP